MTGNRQVRGGTLLGGEGTWHASPERRGILIAVWMGGGLGFSRPGFRTDVGFCCGTIGFISS